MRNVRYASIVVLVFLCFVMLAVPLEVVGNFGSIDTIEAQGAHLRAEDPAPPVGFENRTISGTTTYLGEGVYDTQYLTVENEWIEKAKRHLERTISALEKAKEAER